MARELHLLQADKLVRPVTKPEWTGREGEKDCDLETFWPCLGGCWIVSVKVLWWWAKGVTDVSQVTEAETWSLRDIGPHGGKGGASSLRGPVIPAGNCRQKNTVCDGGDLPTGQETHFYLFPAFFFPMKCSKMSNSIFSLFLFFYYFTFFSLS